MKLLWVTSLHARAFREQDAQFSHGFRFFSMNTGHLDRAMSRAGLHLCGRLQQLHEDSKAGLVISTLPHDIVLHGLQFPAATAMLLFPRISLYSGLWCKFREGKTVA
jgi:hypothetical protein